MKWVLRSKRRDRAERLASLRSELWVLTMRGPDSHDLGSAWSARRRSLLAQIEELS